MTQQRLQRHGLRELGGAPEAAPRRVVLGAQGSRGLNQHLATGRAATGAQRQSPGTVECLGDAPCLVTHVAAALVPSLMHPLEDVGERRHATSGGGREVCAGEEGLTFRG